MRIRSLAPLVVGALAAATLLVVALVMRGSGAPEALTHTPARAATATAAPPSATEATASSPDDPSLVLGRRLVIPASARLDAAPFEVQTSFGGGGTFALDADAAGSITLVFFMAAWCPTCPGEAIALRQLHEDYRDRGVTVLIVDVDQEEGEPELAAFRELTGNADHYWALDRDFVVARALEVNTLDATIVIDAQGRIAYRDGSPTPYEDLAAVVDALLAEG